MNITSRLLYGNSVTQNTAPGQTTGAKVKLTGTSKGKTTNKGIAGYQRKASGKVESETTKGAGTSEGKSNGGQER